MKKQGYFLRIKDGKIGGERGHVYREATNVFLPDGFVAYMDEHSTTPEHIEVHPADELRRISESQYLRITSYLMEGTEPGNEIAGVLEELESESRLQARLEVFQRAARALLAEWERLPYGTRINERLTESYPFSEEFSEVVAKIGDWGEDE